MVEQTRRPNRAVSLQAGPGEVDTGILSDVNLRYRAGPLPAPVWQQKNKNKKKKKQISSGKLNTIQ